MKKYRIKKLGQNTKNKYSYLSVFGHTQEYFEGYSKTPPIKGERFDLRNSLGGLVISTSIVTKVQKNQFTTVYSVYSIKEIIDDVNE